MCCSKQIYVTFILLYYAECFNVEFKTLSTVYLPFTYSPTAQYALDKDAAEQMAYDPASNIIYSVGHSNLHVIDISDVHFPKVLFHKSYDNVDGTDVEVCGDHVFVAFDNETVREDGFVDVFKAFNKSSSSLDLIHHIVVGDIPDMIQPIKDCSKVIVAIEAEPYIDTIHDRLVDNPGGVGVITFTYSPSGDYNYNVVDFRKFNARFTELEKTGVRWINRENNTFANDIEPEYIAFNADETKAYICLQENNAIAVFDMKTEQIEDILGLGFKNWNYYTMDASDKDGGIHMRPWPVFGMYQPDSIKHYTHQGVDYLIMGNEGDSKDYGPYFTEEIQVKDVELSSLFESNETIRREMQEKSQLGRLKVAAGDGKNRETGKYDKLYAFGGRSFSIRRADTMELVYDSGIEIAHKTSLLHSNLFNSGYKEGHLVAASMDSRSDNKGPETESVTMGHFGDTTLLMIGNERPGTIAVYTIDERLSGVAPTFVTLLTGINRTDDTWDNLYKNREISMLDPEDIRFIQGEESPNGKPLLLVSGSTSGTVSIIEVNVDLSHQQDDPVTAQIRSSASFVCLSKVLLVIYIGLFLWRRWERNLPV